MGEYKINITKFTESAYLIIFLSLLLFLGYSNLAENKLEHEFPYGLLASDSFQQQTRVESIKDAGNYKKEAFYIVKGFKDVMGYYPPLIHHLGVLFSYVSGLEAYDTTYFMVFLISIFAAGLMYIIIRQYNKKIAILSLPLSILIFSQKSYIGYVWGHWGSITAQAILIFTFWSITRLDYKNMEIILGIFLGAVGLAHTSELVYVAMFMAYYAIYLLFNKKFTLKIIKKIGISSIIALLLSGYYLFIFANTFLASNPYSFTISTAADWGGTPLFYLKDFQALLIIMGVGAILGLFLIKKINIPVLIGFFMLFIGYTNYIGFRIRAFQSRFFWPIYLSIFLGLGLYIIIKFIPKKFRVLSTYSISIIMILALSNVIAIPNIPTYNRISSPGLMDKYHWEAFKWISENTPQDSKIYFFYGDVYDQDAILRNSKRTHAQIVSKEFVGYLQNKSIKRYYATEWPADHGAGIPYWKSFMSIGRHLKDDNNEGYIVYNTTVDVCVFDYFVLDKYSRQQALTQYNIIIANELVNNSAQVVFNNDLVVILKNNRVNGDCIEEKRFE